MAVTHASHIGVEGCIRGARDTLYWPRMATELKEYVSKWDVCLVHRSAPGRKPCHGGMTMVKGGGRSL